MNKEESAVDRPSSEQDASTEKESSPQPENGEMHENPEGVQEETSEDSGEENGGSEAWWKEELERHKKLADEHFQRFLRMQADFENFKRRTRQEKEELIRNASRKLIELLLPVVDNVERALQASAQNKDFDALVKGVEMTFRQLMQVLEQEGLKTIEAVGKPFNPELHQALMQVESADHEEGTVLEEIQKGYLLNDKVLRPALVKVSKSVVNS